MNKLRKSKLSLEVNCAKARHVKPRRGGVNVPLEHISLSHLLSLSLSLSLSFLFYNRQFKGGKIEHLPSDADVDVAAKHSHRSTFQTERQCKSRVEKKKVH